MTLVYILSSTPRILSPLPSPPTHPFSPFTLKILSTISKNTLLLVTFSSSPLYTLIFSPIILPQSSIHLPSTSTPFRDIPFLFHIPPRFRYPSTLHVLPVIHRISFSQPFPCLPFAPSPPTVDPLSRVLPVSNPRAANPRTIRERRPESLGGVKLRHGSAEFSRATRPWCSRAIASSQASPKLLTFVPVPRGKQTKRKKKQINSRTVH